MLICGLALGDMAFSAPLVSGCHICECVTPEYYMLCNADVKIPANGNNCSGPGIPEKREKYSVMPEGLDLGVACKAA